MCVFAGTWDCMCTQLIMTNKSRSGNFFINAGFPLTKLNFHTLGFFGKKINSHVLDKTLWVLALTCAYTHLCICTYMCAHTHTYKEKKRQRWRSELMLYHWPVSANSGDIMRVILLKPCLQIWSNWILLSSQGYIHLKIHITNLRKRDITIEMPWNYWAWWASAKGGSAPLSAYQA